MIPAPLWQLTSALFQTPVWSKINPFTVKTHKEANLFGQGKHSQYFSMLVMSIFAFIVLTLVSSKYIVIILLSLSTCVAVRWMLCSESYFPFPPFIQRRSACYSEYDLACPVSLLHARRSNYGLREPQPDRP